MITCLSELKEVIQDMTGLQEHDIKIERGLGIVTVTTRTELNEEIKEAIKMKMPLDTVIVWAANQK